MAEIQNSLYDLFVRFVSRVQRFGKKLSQPRL